MESATEDLYFQKLQELVQYEDKIVTLASLAADLGISIQNSQKLITKYVKDHRKLNPNDLAVTYALTGRLKSNGGRAVFMVKEEDLEDKLRLLEEKPSKLIYSVQKNKNVDLNVVALVDMFDATKIRDKALDGSIVSKNCVKRVLKLKKLPPPPPATTKGKSSFFEPKPGKSTDVNKSAEKCPPPKTEQKDKASGSIANLFKTAAAKSNKQNSEKKTPVSNKQTNKRSGGLTGFLTSGSLKSKTDNSTPKKESNESNKQNGSEIIEIPEEMKDVDVMEIFDDFEEDKKQVKTEEPREEPIKKNEESKKQNKRRREKSQQRPSKRRKRIVEHNDSDSDGNINSNYLNVHCFKYWM
ncbi:hypothetical protein NQ317_012431 [Molorchus minor]|uniref:DNA polymerase delta subunit 3 n=1 Tax=Molorchus minor TaxID=1323400 RepID=A0ABQ9JWI6_9CUCU|nr:hypothetical protein NQ317_012431 [Molorchus minor]